MIFVFRFQYKIIFKSYTRFPDVLSQYKITRVSPVV